MKKYSPVLCLLLMTTLCCAQGDIQATTNSDATSAPVNSNEENRGGIVYYDIVANGQQIPLTLIPGDVDAFPKLADESRSVLSGDLGFPGWFDLKNLPKGTTPNGLSIIYDLKAQNGNVLVHLRWQDGPNSMLIEDQQTISEDHLRDVLHAFTKRLVKEFYQEDASTQSHIVYVSGEGRDRSISYMDWDGARSHVLVSGIGRAAYPSLSSNGKDLYFSSMKPGYSSLYHYDLQTKKLRQLRPGHQCFQPRISPDGSRLLYSELVVDNTDLWVMDLSNESVEALVRDPAAETSASWSPNGSEVYFSSDRTGGPQIYKVNADGTEMSRISFHGRYNTGAMLSPKGDKLAFSRMEGSRMSLYLLDLKSGDEKMLANQGNNESPSWSPDAKMITFCSDRSGRPEIYLIRADGTGALQISHGAASCHPSWTTQ